MFQLVGVMHLIATFFLYPFMDQKKIWYGTKVFVFCLPKKPTVDLTAIFNSVQYSVNTNDDEYENYQLSTTDNKENSET